jgi:branched-chain amino acid transport system substrate-binding protein
MSPTTLLRGFASAAVLAASALALAGCFGGSAPVVTGSPTPIPTMAQPIPTGDGTLLIGVVVPLSGADAAVGAPALAGAELAVRDIREAGGVNGGPVLLVHGDAGDASTATAAASVAALATRGVDALLGPLAPGVLPAFVAAAESAGIAAVGATGEPVAADEAFTARLRTADPTLADTRHGVEAYDAVVLLALAAELAGDDGRTSVAQLLPAATAGSIACGTYGECLAVLGTGSGIRYTGVTGQLSTGVVQVTAR